MANSTSRGLNYRISLTTDAGQVYQELQKLQKELSNISLGKINLKSDTTITELNAAADAASRLSTQLKNALNVETGKLDLSKFQASLQSSGMTLEKYGESLIRVGDDGRKAFMNLAKVITQSELPLIKTNKLMDSLWTTMKNTIRWQVTTSALRTFTGGIQTAYNYAQDLNESLNSIRIVSQKSADDMKEFAKQANNAAKNLSTVTTNYTNASLIYYQQGLNDQQVQGRTDTTIKLANVARESAEVASEQLTAIWNNFYDGSKTLEYYADVMVALGASTASSSDEIAAGIQKFAAVAGTVGLSYEYAAAALATLTANTREAPEVIGNSLKTLFARLQGLSLGETLDDGTDLNKYSKALKAVGVDIFDLNHNLKSMDILLDETAQKWEILTKDQKTALAQTVAGVRQYNQFVSLMDNWGDFQKNLQTAYGSTGALEEQAEVFAESWEAARKRVKASAEDIYDSLINEDFFISFDNGVSVMLNGVADVIDSLGGMQGVLAAVSTLMFNVYGDKIADGIRNLVYNLNILTGAEQARAIALKQEMQNYIPQFAGYTGQQYFDNLVPLYQNQIEAQIIVNEQTAKFNDYQKASIANEQRVLDLVTERGIAYAELAEKEKESVDAIQNTLSAAIKSSYSPEALTSNMVAYNQQHGKGAAGKLMGNVKNIMKYEKNQLIGASQIEQIINKYRNLQNAIASTQPILSRYNELNTESGRQNEITAKELERLQKEFSELVSAGELSEETLERFKSEAQTLYTVLTQLFKGSDTDVNRFTEAVTKSANANVTARLSIIQQEQALTQLQKKIEQVSKQQGDFASQMVRIGQIASSTMMGINAIRNLGRIFTDEDLNASERFIGILTSISMLLPALNALNTQFAESTVGLSIAQQISNAAIAKGNVTLEGGIVAKAASVVANKILAKSEEEVAAAATIRNAVLAAGAVYVAAAAAAIGALVGVIYLAVKAYNAESDAAKEASAQIDIFTNNLNECTSAAQELKTAIGDYQDGVEQLKNLTEGSDEFRQSLEETNKKAKELIETYGLWNDYKYDNGLITFNKETLENIQNEADKRTIEAQKSLYMAQMYSNEASLASQRTNIIRSLGNIVESGAMYEYGGENIAVRRSLTKDELASAVDLLRGYDETPISDEALVTAFKDLIPGLNLSTDSLENFTSKLDELSEATDKAKQANEYYAKEILGSEIKEEFGERLRDIAGENETLFNNLLNVMTNRINNLKDEDDRTRVEALSDISVNKFDYGSNSALSRYLGIDISNDEVLTRLYAERILKRPNVDELDYKGTFSWGTSNLQDRQGNLLFQENISDEYMRKMLAIDFAQQQVLDSLNALNDTFNQEAYENSLQKLVNGFNNLSEQFGGADFTQVILNALANGDYKNEKLDFSNLFSELSEQNKNNIVNMTPEELMNILGLDEKTLGDIGVQGGLSWIKNFQDTLEQTYDPTIFFNSISASSIAGESSARALIEGIQSGDINYKNIKDNEDYQELLKTLEAIKDEYPQIAASANVLSKTWEVGTQTYMESLEEVQNQLAKIKLESLIKDAKTLTDELTNEDGFVIDVDANTEDFENKINSILDANYSIDIEVHTQAEQEFQSIVNAMNDIEAKASMIGEDFIVSAENIRTLNNTFPGIIQGLEDLGNGSVRVNQQIAEAAIGAARTEVAADMQATVDKLNNQATLLRAKQSVYEKMAEAADLLASNEVLSDEASSEARAVISSGLSELEQLNSEIASTTEMTHNEQVANNSRDNARIVAENWTEGFYAAAQASAKFADAAIQNMRSAVAGHGPITTGNFSVNYKGSSGVSEEAAAIQEAQNALDETDSDKAKEMFARVSNNLEAMARMSGAAANDIEGMVAQLGASTIELDKLFKNVSSGKGPNPKESKSKEKEKQEGKVYEEEDAKTLEEIEDRYHEITREILRQSDLLDDIGNDLDRAYGIDKLRKYKREWEALNKQLDNYNSKLNEATERYLPQDIQKLRDLFGAENIDSRIKANGELANYEGLLQQVIDEHKKFEDSYNQNFVAKLNAMASDKEAQEAWLASIREDGLTQEEYWKQRKEAADQDYEDRLAALKQYEETRDTIQEIRDNIEDTMRAIADNRLSQIEYRLEIVIDVKNMKDAIREFDKKVAEIFNDALTHGFDVARLSKEQAEVEAAMYPEYADQYRRLVDEYESADDYVDRDRIMKDIQDLQGKVLDSAEAIVEWVNSIEDIVPDAVDAAAARFKLFTDQLEHNTTILDTIKELYALQGVTYKTMDGFNRLQRVSQEKLEAQVADAKLQKAWYEEAAIKLQQAQSALDSLNGNENDLRYDTYKKARDAYLQEFNEAQEAYLSLAKEAMETAQEMYLQQIDRAVYKFGQAVSGGIGLDLLQDKYDHYIEKDERYFDKVNEAYQTLSWYNKLQADIDATTNAKTKERLKALQEEIDARREGNKLSQYDLDILNAKYEVLKAQMALEDAQNTKNKLQLVRDRQGNWNYQYTADPEQVEDAEQDLLDAENEWYNIAKQQVADVTGEIIKTWQECQDKIKEIYSDMTLTDQERSDRAAEIYAYYTDKIKYLEEEKQVAIKDMTDAGNASMISIALATGGQLEELTGITADDIKKIVEDSGNSIKGLLSEDLETIKSIFAGTDGLTDIINTFDNVFAKDLDNMTKNTGNFELELRKTLEQADIDFNRYKDTVDNVADETGTNLDDLAHETDKVSDSTDRLLETGLMAADSLWNMIGAAQDLAWAYADMTQEIWGTVEALRALAEEQANYMSSKADLDNKEWKTNDWYAPDYSYVMLDRYYSGAGWDAIQNAAIKREDKTGGQYGGLATTSQIMSILQQASNGNSKAQAALEAVHNGSMFFNDDWIKYVKNLGLSFDTGGYTGSFPDAKLAFLHEKELVLNSQDTKNILDTVSTVRTIDTDFIEKLENTIDNSVLAAIALMGQKANIVIPSNEPDQIEQHIIIERVEFPNAINHNEIEEAFNNLANDASQYIRRRRD